MKEVTEIQKRFIHWFSGIPLPHAQKVNNLTSLILAQWRGIKDNKGNQCRVSPCGKHEYSRGLCAIHYSQISLLRKHTKESWRTFYQIGLCLPSKLEMREAYKNTNTVQSENDPLRILLTTKK